MVLRRNKSPAAEVQYHAEQAISNYNGIINAVVDAFGRSIYERAIRADMATDDSGKAEWHGKYHDLSSEIVLEQTNEHGNI